MTPTTAMPAPVLDPTTIYLAHDRFVHATARCAGMTALYSGVTIDGARLTPVTVGDVADWPTDELGPLTCECGALTAVGIARDARGTATTKATA